VCCVFIVILSTFSLLDFRTVPKVNILLQTIEGLLRFRDCGQTCCHCLIILEVSIYC
jgi:hypothetical protein